MRLPPGLLEDASPRRPISGAPACVEASAASD